MRQIVKFILFLLLFRISINSCTAQDCKSIKKLKFSAYTTYVGIIDVPPDYNNTTTNRFFTVDLAKYVKIDTNFVFGLSMIAFDAPVASASVTSNLVTVTLQFEGDSAIVKLGQSLDTTPMSEGRAMLSTNVRLTLNEILAIRDGLLISITIANSKVIVPETMSKDLKEVAKCLPHFW